MTAGIAQTTDDTASLVAAGRAGFLPGDVPARPGVLPDHAAEVYRSIENGAEDASDLASSAQQRLYLDKMELHRLSAEIADFERQAKWSMDDPGYKALVRGREQLRKDRSLGQARYEEKSERAGTLVAIRSRIDDWRRENGHSIIVRHTRPAPRLGKGEFPAAAVTRIRQALQAARSERATVASAPATSAEVKAAVRTFVVETGALARPDVSGLMGGDAHVFFPEIAEVPMPGINLPDYGMTRRGGRVRDGLALACWLMPDTVIAAMDREIDAAADDGRAMTAEAKAARLAELDEAILGIERDEVAFIAMAEQQGATVNHRRDVDPRAVLGVEVREAA